MKRRDFIQLTAIGGSLPFLSLSACTADQNNKKEDFNSKVPFELEETPVEEVQEEEIVKEELTKNPGKSSTIAKSF